MGKRRTVILLLMSLVLALGAAWIANTWLQMRTAGVTAGSNTERPVVIAAVRIPYGQKIERRHVSLVTLPRAAIPSNTFSDRGGRQSRPGGKRATSCGRRAQHLQHPRRHDCRKQACHDRARQ